MTTTPERLEALVRRLDESRGNSFSGVTLFVFTVDGDPEWIPPAVGDDDDPYRMVASAADMLAGRVAALVATGWAVPAEVDDGPVRLNPHRVRVRVVVGVTPSGVSCSLIRQADEPEPQVVLDGGGPLMEALLEAVAA